MKKGLLLFLLVVSVLLNVYHFGKDYWVGMYTPNEKDQVILSEMVQLVVESKEYQQLVETEKVRAIAPSVDRNKGGRYPFHYGVSVRTDRQTYIFYCQDESCSSMTIGAWTYSRYSEQEPVLLLKE
ncbi:hypothetical protein [Sporosarcina sp. ACRSL]|uniref:hypothetical protein n=1 Tax=Sporosarcina sp. ACRSL TaxID=2918215 RepID=UPI001EF3DEF5|nr:hypothetical protein [Sporosarcina sp. ACRSL]